MAIIGRPVGWSVPFAECRPVDAIVAENGAGAVALVRPPRSAAAHRLYLQDPATRASNFTRMQDVARRALEAVLEARLAQDSPGRETDIAIDHSEFLHLAPEQIGQVVAIWRSQDMNATVSSMHVNGWFGDHGKLAGARWTTRSLYGIDLDSERDRWACVGDSTNDQAMFQAFSNTVGVANIRRFLNGLHRPPTLCHGG